MIFKMKKTYLLTMLFAAFALVACEGDDDTPEPEPTPAPAPTPTPTQPSTPTLYDYNALISQHDHLLMSYSKNGQTAYSMEYDSKRRLTSVKGAEGYALGFSIDYDKRTITENRQQGNRVYQFTLNKQGYIDSLACNYSLLNHDYRVKLVYEYDSDYLTKASFTYLEDGKPSYAGIDYHEATYQYTDGLLTTVKYGDTTWKFSYGDVTNTDRLHPVGFCPLMVSFIMPNECTMSANDLLYYTGLFGKISAKLPDGLTFYKNFTYDHPENYQQNEEYGYITEYAFSYTSDTNGIASMTMTMPKRQGMYPPYEITFQYANNQ